MTRFAAVGTSAFLLTTAAVAKEFPPGSLMICGAKQCRTVDDPAQSHAFSSLLWGDGRLRRAPIPRIGSPIFQLRFKDGPAGAIISATAIRVHGLRCGRFRRGKWYRLPSALKGVTRGLEPKRLRASVPRSC
jgi:hypothetical protein